MSIISLGIPIANASIARKLEKIAALRYDSENDTKRLVLLKEASILLGIPILYSVLTIINQGHRFNIIESQGCQPAVFVTPVAIIIDYGFPLATSLFSIYCSSAYILVFCLTLSYGFETFRYP